MALGDGTLIVDDGVFPLQVTGTNTGEPMTVGQQTILRRVTMIALDHLKPAETLVPMGEPSDSILQPQATETVWCSVSGSVLVSSTTATSGHLEFRDCMEFEGGVYVLLSGRVELSNVEVSERSCINSFSATARFRDLSASSFKNVGGPELNRVTVAGSANMSVVDKPCEGTSSTHFQGSSLSFRTRNESYGYFDFDIRIEDLGDYSEDNIRATLDISSLPGSVRVTTPQRLKSFWYDDLPHAGQLRLTADRGGYLLATINASSGPSAVSIIGDFNNDRVIDGQAEVSWEQVVGGSWSYGSGAGTGGGDAGGQLIPISTNTLRTYQVGDYLEYSVQGSGVFTDSFASDRFFVNGTVRETISISPVQLPEPGAPALLASNLVGDGVLRWSDGVTEPFTDTSQTYFYQDSLGSLHVVLDDEGFQYNYPTGSLELQSPLGVGVSWANAYEIRDPSMSATAFIAVEEACAVQGRDQIPTPIGTFETFRIQCTYAATPSDFYLYGCPFTEESTSWVHPSVGLIKETSTQTDFPGCFGGGAFRTEATILLKDTNIP